MADFFTDTLAPHILAKEGGYTDNPNDRGGETIWGITVAVARENGFTGSMRTMTREQALAIYRLKFWTKPGFDQVATRSRRLAAGLFDLGVNSGVNTAGRFVQIALNAFNRQGKDYADMKVDGSVGPTTLRCLDALIQRRGLADSELVLLRALESQRGNLFLTISDSRPANEEFTFGWFKNRLTSIFPLI
jgi:lysozyme family protein